MMLFKPFTDNSRDGMISDMSDTWLMLYISFNFTIVQSPAGSPMWRGAPQHQWVKYYATCGFSSTSPRRRHPYPTISSCGWHIKGVGAGSFLLCAWGFWQTHWLGNSNILDLYGSWYISIFRLCYPRPPPRVVWIYRLTQGVIVWCWTKYQQGDDIFDAEYSAGTFVITPGRRTIWTAGPAGARWLWLVCQKSMQWNSSVWYIMCLPTGVFFLTSAPVRRCWSHILDRRHTW